MSPKSRPPDVSRCRSPRLLRRARSYVRSRHASTCELWGNWRDFHRDFIGIWDISMGFHGISWGYLWDLMRCIGFFHGILMGFVVSDLADCWLSARHGWTVPVFDLWPHEGSEKNQQILDIQQTSL